MNPGALSRAETRIQNSEILRSLARDILLNSEFRFLISVFRWPGGHSGGIPPDPIPNSAVKAPSAHGTTCQHVGESVAARPAKNGKNKSRHHDKQQSPACESARGFFVTRAASPQRAGMPAIRGKASERLAPLHPPAKFEKTSRNRVLNSPNAQTFNPGRFL